MAILPLSHSETKSEPHLHLQDSAAVVKEKTSASEMAELEGRLLVAEAAEGPRMSKAKIAAVALLTTLILTGAALSMARYDRTGDYFLWVCVVSHVSTICLLATLAATARTPADRRHFAESTAASTLHLAVNLFFVLVACPRKVQDGA